MKIMIFGDSASGKSSFVQVVAARESLPLIHLDRVMDEMGRESMASVGSHI